MLYQLHELTRNLLAPLVHQAQANAAFFNNSRNWWSSLPGADQFAAMNEVIWRNFSTDVYVFWDTFGQMGVMFAFLMSNYRLIEKHWTGER